MPIRRRRPTSAPAGKARKRSVKLSPQESYKRAQVRFNKIKKQNRLQEKAYQKKLDVFKKRATTARPATKKAKPAKKRPGRIPSLKDFAKMGPLTPAQRKELREWQKKNPDWGPRPRKPGEKGVREKNRDYYGTSRPDLGNRPYQPGSKGVREKNRDYYGTSSPDLGNRPYQPGSKGVREKNKDYYGTSRPDLGNRPYQPGSKGVRAKNQEYYGGRSPRYT